MYYMRRLFRETPIFTERIDELGSEEILLQIIDAILENPEAGATIAGTGGIRKMRAAEVSVAVLEYSISTCLIERELT
jgi:hypothetical protein